MKYRTLGSTGLKVSVVGVGAWQFGGEWGIDYDEASVAAVIDAARESGINLIDTAECYGDHLSEKLIGPAVAKDREKWILATKFGHHFHDRFTRTDEIEPAKVLKQLEDSLRALRTEYIDLYQFHSLGDPAFDNPVLWETLRKEKEKGKIRHLGISIGSNQNIHQTGKAKEVGSETIQAIYNRLDRGPEAGVFPICEKDKLGVLARVPLASGFLSGKYKPGVAFPATDVRDKWWTAERRDQTAREVEAIQKNEVPAGVPMARWALAWCLKHPAVTAVIPGCKDPKQTRENAAAADLELK